MDILLNVLSLLVNEIWVMLPLINPDGGKLKIKCDKYYWNFGKLPAKKKLNVFSKLHASVGAPLIHGPPTAESTCKR